MDITFDTIDRPASTELWRARHPSTWEPLVSALLGTMTSGKALSVPTPAVLKTFKNGLYAHMQAHKVTTRCYFSQDRTRLILWAEPKKPGPGRPKKRP